MIDTLLEIYDLKDEKRTGWQLRNIDKPESVASHSWGTAFLTLKFIPENLNSERTLKMAICHDIAEADIGDIAKRAVDADQEISADEKEKLEKETIEKYSENLEKELIELWKEYEEKETEEAKFVKDMDLIDMCLQALKYEKQERYDPEEENENFQRYDNLDEFFATTEGRLQTETGKDLFTDIRSKYRAARDS